ncbi:MAG: TonB-dependent receptor family protein [Prevotellaceae bacterium]|jgi:hypothetical protein|nr:TonB-dependent receptor family protein [Prevotellaceae bacterium]
MKKIIIMSILQLIVTAAFAQNLTVKGIVTSEDSIPVASANIVLQNANSEIVTGVETDIRGEFILQNLIVGENYKLSISFVGYETQEFDFEKPTKDIDLGNIVLFKASIELQTAEVKARTTKMFDDRRIVYPTQKQKELTGDGITLLSSMRLPKLTVVPASNSITYWGRNGDLKLYINDVPATTEQILSLASKDILYIEYIDHPDAKYTGAGLVLNYVVKRFESGITGNVNANKSLNRNMFSGGIMLKANHKNSEFGIDYNFHTEKDTRNFDITDEQFNFSDGSVLQRYEKPLDVLGKGYGHNIALSYVYNKPQNTLFYIKSQYTYNKTPNDDIISNLYNFGIRTDTTMREINKSANAKQLYNEIFYRKDINEKQNVEIKAYNIFNETLMQNSYREYNNILDISNIQSTVNGKSYATLFRTDYSANVNKTDRILAGIIFTHKNIDNIYSGTDNSTTDINTLLAASYIQYSGRSGKLSYHARLLARLNRVSQKNENKYTRYEFAPLLRVAYQIKDDMWIDYRIIYAQHRPSLSDMSNSVQSIDDLQSRRGNPLLKTGNSIDQTLTGYFSVLNWDVTFTFEHLYNPKYIVEETFIENNKFVRIPVNMKYNHAFYNECEISTELFGFIEFSYTLGFNRFINKGETYKHYYGKWYNRLTGTLNMAGWRLDAMIWNHNNDFYGENLWTSGRGMVFTLLRTWFNGSLTTSLACYNPFSNYTKQGTVNYSNIAPYSNWTYSNTTHRLVQFGLSYRFNYGRNPVSDVSTRSNVKSDSGIINSNKAAAKAEKRN